MTKRLIFAKFGPRTVHILGSPPFKGSDGKQYLVFCYENIQRIVFGEAGDYRVCNGRTCPNVIFLLFLFDRFSNYNTVQT